MKFDSEDPRLTSYLLDELDESERKEVDALLAEDAEARDFVESMRATTEALQAEMATLPDPRLDDLRRARIASAARRPSRKGWMLGVGAIAAAAAIVLYGAGSKDEKAKTEIVAAQSAVRPEEQDNPGPVAAVTIPDPNSVNEDPAPQTKSNLADGTTQDPRAAGILGTGFAARDKGSNRGQALAATGYGSNGQDANATTTGAELDRVIARARLENAEARGEAGERALESLGYFAGRMGDADYYRPEPALPVVDNTFVAVAKEALSTFSIDVDTASYSQVRRYLRGGSLPPPATVRIEELINYFSYEYPTPKPGEPFAVATEVARAPWAPEHKLVRVGLKAREMVQTQRPRANLVFLLDVSGSMRSDDKLPLLKKSFAMLMQKLDKEDRIAIVVYAGASGLALPSTEVANDRAIARALRRLNAGGSTNGGAGIELAYKVATENFIEGGVNRVILATDGDFNVGTSSRDALVALIEAEARSNVFLTVLGVGMSTQGDGTMEGLADKGNGNYASIDTLAEAKKVLVDQIHGTLVTVAKDVKLQVEFNPKRVASYRLIGYENRVLANEDFNNDAKDAGDIGAGHSVTALYEIVPAGGTGSVDALRYQSTAQMSAAADSDELLTVKLRYKQPTGSTSLRVEHPVYDAETGFGEATADFKFASAVAAFGMVLRNSEHRGSATMARILDWAEEGKGHDPHEYRAEFVSLVRRAVQLGR